MNRNALQLSDHRCGWRSVSELRCSSALRSMPGHLLYVPRSVPTRLLWSMQQSLQTEWPKGKRKRPSQTQELLEASSVMSHTRSRAGIVYRDARQRIPHRACEPIRCISWTWSISCLRAHMLDIHDAYGLTALHTGPASPYAAYYGTGCVSGLRAHMIHIRE